MGIRFLCPACGKKINVKEHQAGLRGFCPKCQARIDIPLESQLPGRKERDEDSDSPLPSPRLETAASGGTSPGMPATGPAAGAATTAAAAGSPAGNVPVGRIVSMSAAPVVDPLAEFPTYQWYVTAPGAAQPFGPADGPTMFQWLQEGRVVAASMVWRQDWPQWRPAGSVWPQLAGPTHFAAAPALQAPLGAPSPPMAAIALPAPAAAPLLPGGPTMTPAGTPAGSAPPGPGIYYQRRTNGAYAATVVVLILLVLVMAVVMYLVLTKKMPGLKAGTDMPALTAGTESVPTSGERPVARSAA